MSWFGGKKKQKKKQYSGFSGDCSDYQLQVLEKFKAHVHQVNKLPKQKFDEIYLLRFLRARKFDLPKTIKMWDNYIQWRIKQDIDNCWKFQFPELPQLRKMYPHGYHKVDKQFRPIYIERVGFMDVEKIFKVMKAESMLNYYALLYETLLTTIFDGCTKARLQATGQNGKVCQTITILDLKHVKLGNVSKAHDFLKPVTAMAQDNYPEILGNMFIVNAPMLFTGIWAIVKMWIDDKTKQKIKILGSSYKKQLLQFIDAQNLPAFLDGGKCTCGAKQCCLEANGGPWNPEGKQMFQQNIDPKEKQQKQEENITENSSEIVENKQDQIHQGTHGEKIQQKKQQYLSKGGQIENNKQEKTDEQNQREKAEKFTKTQQPLIQSKLQKQLGEQMQNKQCSQNDHQIKAQAQQSSIVDKPVHGQPSVSL